MTARGVRNINSAQFWRAYFAPTILTLHRNLPESCYTGTAADLDPHKPLDIIFFSVSIADLASHDYSTDFRFALLPTISISKSLHAVITAPALALDNLPNLSQLKLVARLCGFSSPGTLSLSYEQRRYAIAHAALSANLSIRTLCSALRESPTADDLAKYHQTREHIYLRSDRAVLILASAVGPTNLDVSNALLEIASNPNEAAFLRSLAIWAIGRNNCKSSIPTLHAWLDDARFARLQLDLQRALQYLCSGNQLVPISSTAPFEHWRHIANDLPQSDADWQARDVHSVFWEKRCRTALTPVSPAVLNAVVADEVAPVRRAAQHAALSPGEPCGYSYSLLETIVEAHGRLLSYFGISREALCAQGAVPDWLLFALERLGKQATLASTIRDGMAARVAYYPRLPYTQKQYWLKVINLWIAVLKAHDVSVLARPETEILSAYERAVAAREKWVYSYPYFLTPAKADFFNIIPLGRQTSLGLLVPDNKDWAKPIHEIAASASKAHTPDASGDLGRTALAAICNLLHKSTKVFFVRTGYVTNELLFGALCQAGGVNLADPLQGTEILKIPLTEKEQKQENAGQIVHVPHNWEPEDGIFVYDPAVGPPDGACAEAKMTPYLIRHGLDVPVGVGFTPPVVADLVDPGVRQQLCAGLLALGTPPRVTGIEWSDVQLATVAGA